MAGSNVTTMSSPTGTVDETMLIVGALSHAASAAPAVSPLSIRISFDCMIASLGSHEISAGMRSEKNVPCAFKIQSERWRIVWN
jgi:hypothetical protein